MEYKMNLSRQEIIALLKDEKNQQSLFAKADEIRQKYVGDEVHLRALIEFSNICRNNCMYCGIRKDNHNIKRYHMSEDELVVTAKSAAEMGFKTVVMQSGEDMYYNPSRLCNIIERIKKFDVAITLSIGERDYDEYKAFKEAGADRYLLRIETTDKDLYHKLDPDMSWNRRYECLCALRDLGYEVGSGIMVGLPEQTIESIADDLLFLQNFGVDMAGIGPFIPHSQTPLKDCAGGSLGLALRTMAVMRFLLEDINIPATTAMETLHPNGRILALKSGANVVMPNVTEGEYRRLYELYPGKICINDTPAQCRTCIGAKILSIGRKIGTGFGGHKK